MAWLDFTRDNMAKDNALILVAEVDGQIVGHCQAFITPYPPVLHRTHYGELMELVVLPGFRRQGVGGRLLGRVKQWYKKNGITRMEARALACNRLSTGFYCKKGFKPYLETYALDLGT